MRRDRVETIAPHAVDLVRRAAIRLDGSPSELDALLERVGEARFVLLGEATHGTHEFYETRARITERLVREKGFRAVAVEADWPDAFRVNRFVRGLVRGPAVESLAGFRRFPTWMWRNADVLALVESLRSHNDRLPARERVGFYGLDLYSLNASIEAVLRYLDEVDPKAALLARGRYGCFDRYGEDVQAYGCATAFGVAPSCEDEVVNQLRELHARSADYVARDGRFAPDEHFHAEQNARLVANAERYYRAMYRGRVLSWNLRDRHMVETLEALAKHLEGTGPTPVKVVVWAHNSHLGDARATEMGDGGECNVGQLMRERLGGSTFLVGFTTHHGTVTAARDWDGPAERRVVRPALEGSYESLFHAVAIPRFLLFPRAEGAASVPPSPLLERAIGVVYRPETERQSHWFEARLPLQFDAVIHLDQTTAVVPLEPTADWRAGEPPETYPTGL